MDKKDSDIVSPLRRIRAKMVLLSLINKAKAEYDKTNYSGCEETCLEILKTEPNNITALRGLGCVYMSYGQKEKAIEYYKKSLELSDNKEIDYALLGTVYYIHENFDEAIKYFNMAIDLNEGYDYAYEGRNQSMLERHLQICDLQDKLIKNQFD